MRLADLADSRVAVWGYGREGRAAVAVLRSRFPAKALTIFCSEAEAASVARDASLRSTEPPSEPSPSPLDIVTPAPDAATLARFDVVIKSPGISAYRAPYPEAVQRGVRFTSGSALWFAEHAAAKTICVTGTKGKSTVTALIAHMLRKAGRRVALAGNIGMPLLELLDVGEQGAIAEPDWWVIELSSFQTRDFGGTPTVAVINNLYEEHLDWHASRANYAADKLAIAARARHVLVNGEQPELVAVAAAAMHSVFNTPDGWHVRDEAIYYDGDAVLPLSAIPLPGLHNAQNVCAALAAIDAAGEDARLLAMHVATFRALPHRLQPLGARDGIDYVNDSISTTPYAAIEALRSLAHRAVTILVGGFDRGVSWQPFAQYVAAHPPHAIVAMGANRAVIETVLSQIESPAFACESVATLAEGFARARAQTRAGGVILLSPGAPSFDQFHDYAERGRDFALLAGFDPAAIAQIEGLGIA
jgi:UDP-N-acetylmuramoylalanine--D-glutamate ligase